MLSFYSTKFKWNTTVKWSGAFLCFHTWLIICFLSTLFFLSFLIFTLKNYILSGFTIFHFFLLFWIYASILLVPIATCISTENVLKKEVRTAFEPNGSFNWMIHNLEEKGKFSPILPIWYCLYYIFLLSSVFRYLYLIVIINDYINKISVKLYIRFISRQLHPFLYYTVSTIENHIVCRHPFYYTSSLFVKFTINFLTEILSYHLQCLVFVCYTHYDINDNIIY